MQKWAILPVALAKTPCADPKFEKNEVPQTLSKSKSKAWLDRFGVHPRISAQNRAMRTRTGKVGPEQCL
jgi:hypothetical protein